VYTRTHNKNGPGILLIVSLKSAECVAMQLPPNLGSWVETEWQANLASVLNHPVTGDRMRAYWDELTRFAASPEHLQSRNRPSVMHKLRKQAVANAAHFLSMATTQYMQRIHEDEPRAHFVALIDAARKFAIRGRACPQPMTRTTPASSANSLARFART
jgi:hypothetical protein